MHVKLVQVHPHPSIFITDRSTAVVLLWFYVACFWCKSFSDVSCTKICVFIIIVMFGFGCLVATFLEISTCLLDGQHVLFIF